MENEIVYTEIMSALPPHLLFNANLQKCGLIYLALYSIHRLVLRKMNKKGMHIELQYLIIDMSRESFWIIFEFFIYHWKKFENGVNPMSTAIEKMISRRSIRQYKPDMVPDEMLNEIARAGTFAPTGRGKQSPIIVVVKNKETRDRLSELNAKVMGTNADPFYGAPVVIVVLADKSRPTYLYDGSLVISNLLLAAHDLGLGSCWIHRAKEVFDSPEGKALLRDWGIEGDYEGVGHCIVGYVDGERSEAGPRKSNYVHFV